MTSNLSDTRIRSETDFWTDKVSQLTNKINANIGVQQALLQQIADIDNSINNHDYKDAKNNYDNLTNQIVIIKDEYNNSKSINEKNGYLNQINNLKSQKSSYAQKMRIIANENGYSTSLALRTAKSRNLELVTKLINDLKSQLQNANNNRNYYERTAIYRRKDVVQKRNAPIIQEQLADAKDNGYSTIYRTDMQDNSVFKLIETSPSETASNDVATKPIDGSTVETNFISQSSLEYTATFYLVGENFQDCDAQYNKLRDWSYQYEFTINGFSRWQHAFITSIAKSTDSTIAKNAMIVTITFSYARQAQIKYKTITKSKKKHKAATKKTSGSRKGKKGRYIKVKPGMTYWQISRKTGVPLATIMKMNKWKATALPIGVKVRYA